MGFETNATSGRPVRFLTGRPLFRYSLAPASNRIATLRVANQEPAFSHSDHATSAIAGMRKS
jgi:hypothetical protein